MLRQQIQADQLTSLKSGDKPRLETLRFILAHIKNKEIEKKSELDDQETVLVLQKIKRELTETIEASMTAGRPELEASSRAQLAIIDTYLPAEMTDEEIVQAIARIRTEHAAAIEANPKQLIGLCMKELRGRAESSRIMAAINAA